MHRREVNDVLTGVTYRRRKQLQGSCAYSAISCTELMPYVVNINLDLIWGLTCADRIRIYYTELISWKIN